MSKTWWKEMVVYHIYPRSFKDSNGDGIGDIKGITSEIDYIQKLGINAVWLCPVYNSPNTDGGYDISDYRSIDPCFGTLEEWQEMTDKLHERNIKLIMDLQLNHTSDEHAWFEESRRSKDNAKRDYYIWRDGKGPNQPPNNWTSQFQGSAWKLDEATGQYYLHLFGEKEPDLNWDNPEVRREVAEIMKFWLDKGVDGFRLSMINLISKVDGLPDGRVDAKADDPYSMFIGLEHYANGPHVHEYLREINENVLSKYDCVVFGECPFCKREDAAQNYAGEDRHEINMICPMDMLANIDTVGGHKFDLKKWTLPEFKHIIIKWQNLHKHNAWSSNTLGNHDYPRCVSRFGNDSHQFREVSAKLLATLNNTLQGTPFIYQGDEIGMTNMKFETIQDFVDIECRNYWREKVLAGGLSQEKALAAFRAKARDHARTPFQWNPSDNAGFTSGKNPWMRVNENFVQVNAEESLMDPDSTYHYYQKLIALRHNNDVLVYGDLMAYELEDPHFFIYTRTLDDKMVFVTLNFSKNVEAFKVPEGIDLTNAKLLISNYPNNDNIPTILRPYEAIVYLK